MFGELDKQQFNRRIVASLIGAGVSSLALTAYEDYELAKLDEWQATNLLDYEKNTPILPTISH